ncbi:hypothetical protein FGO68_gene9639 [Halteria grandinella]|uniref:Uncharacterized protein n=1 Tax=Halteria grandinella TaxID=5974 RepID=A0A8J8T3M4_HALGN|nr:hypothetical protein FGO68_gene9639 [Halteria grandinella]
MEESSELSQLHTEEVSVETKESPSVDQASNRGHSQRRNRSERNSSIAKPHNAQINAKISSDLNEEKASLHSEINLAIDVSLTQKEQLPKHRFTNGSVKAVAAMRPQSSCGMNKGSKIILQKENQKPSMLNQTGQIKIDTDTSIASINMNELISPTLTQRKTFTLNTNAETGKVNHRGQSIESNKHSTKTQRRDNGPFQQIGEYSKLHHEHQLLQKEFHALKLSNQLLQSKVTDIQLKLSIELTRVSSLEHDLKVKQSTMGQICRDKEATEKKLSEALLENNKLQRSLVKGSKGVVAAEKKLEVKEQLKLAIEDRDRYEAYFNTAQYELMKRDKQIAALENALESMGKKKKKDQNDGGEKVVIFEEYKELKELLAQETKIRTSLQERNQILMKQLNLELQKSVRKSSAGIRVTSSLVQLDEGHDKIQSFKA